MKKPPLQFIPPPQPLLKHIRKRPRHFDLLLNLHLTLTHAEYTANPTSSSALLRLRLRIIPAPTILSPRPSTSARVFTDGKQSSPSSK
jgi:hypothetical protein